MGASCALLCYAFGLDTGMTFKRLTQKQKNGRILEEVSSTHYKEENPNNETQKIVKNTKKTSQLFLWNSYENQSGELPHKPFKLIPLGRNKMLNSMKS